MTMSGYRVQSQIGHLNQVKQIRLEQPQLRKTSGHIHFSNFYSSDHVLVLRRGIFTCASCLKWTCVHLNVTASVYVNNPRESTTRDVIEFCER